MNYPYSQAEVAFLRLNRMVDLEIDRESGLETALEIDLILEQKVAGEIALPTAKDLL